MQIYKSSFKNCLLAALLLAGSLAASIATPSHAKTKPDCCASGEDVYTPSKQRIKIIQSADVNKQLAALKTKPAELAKLRRAISVGNKLIQGHLNNDLYRHGWDPAPYGSQAESLVNEEGWQKHFGSLVSVSVEEFRSFNDARNKSEAVNGNQYITNTRYLHLLCPYGQLAEIEPVNNDLRLTYRFVHIARPNTKNSYMLDRSALDVSQNGKIQQLQILLNSELKFLPPESMNQSWWKTTGDTINIYKRDLRARESTNAGFEKDKPNLRKLIVQITEAEKVCNKPNPLQ